MKEAYVAFVCALANWAAAGLLREKSWHDVKVGRGARTSPASRTYDLENVYYKFED
jgi:hypothetical protein